MCPCQCTLIPCCVLGKLWGRRREEKKVRCHFLQFTTSNGCYAVGICRMSARDPAQFWHKSNTVHCPGNLQSCLGRKATMKRWEKHMILVKSWLSLTFLAFRSFVPGWEGDDRNRIIGSFCSCAQWGFKKWNHQYCKTLWAQEVSCGRMVCAWSEGMFSLLIYVWAKSYIATSSISLEDPFPFLPRSKQLVPSGAPTSPSSVHEQLGHLCPLNTHSPAVS